MWALRRHSTRAKLDAKPAEKLFAFGNFASLHNPKKTTLERSQGAIEKIASFDALRIFPTVRQAMVAEIKEGYNLKSTYISSKLELVLRPSPVQIAALRKINQPRKVPKAALGDGLGIVTELMRENAQKKLKVFTVAAETGSGKTWAYLASVFSKLKEDDFADFAKKRGPQKETVRAVVLLPTHELVSQVFDTAHRAANVLLQPEEGTSPEMQAFLAGQTDLGLNVVKWGTGDSPERLFKQLKRGRIDLLITTPAKMLALAKLENFERPFRYFNSLQYCVVDEADTLLDESWAKDTVSVLQRLPQMRDLILVSATIPKEFHKTLSGLFKDESSLIKVVTPLIHKIPKTIAVKIIDAEQAPYHGSKTRCLAQALYAILNEGAEQGLVKRVLVFVNEKKHVFPLVETLVSKYGHREADIIGVTGGDSFGDRQVKVEPFLKPAVPLGEDLDGSKLKVLVTTDLMARGLNFQGIKNVILMDLPRSSVDLIHRIGRTGRMRQSGRVFVIIDRRTRKSWIKGLPKAVRNGATLG